jgi:hypothetical protein
MDMTRRFGRVGAVLLPIALLTVFFKYLHPVNAILHGIEGWGARKIALTLFISFGAIWALIYVSSILFVRITEWVWNGTDSNLNKNMRYKNNLNQETSSPINKNFQSQNEREELFKLELQDEKAA